jgi:16S rRNA (uracil1498-N3)-methyltransferase
VNLILFEAAEIGCPLPRTDRRAAHLLEVLRRSLGDTFDAGVVNGPRGKATLRDISPDAVIFDFRETEAHAAQEQITLLVGLPRPQTARDILRDATTLSVAALHFIRAEKADANYAQSTLWSSGEWRRHILAGAEQAFSTHVPTVAHGHTLSDAISAVTKVSPHATRLALDNYESAIPLSAAPLDKTLPVALAIGAERGWSSAERDALRAAGFTLAHLGARVLRTETACTAALAIVRAKLGLM